MIDEFRKLKGISLCRISTVPFSMVTQLKAQISFLRENGVRLSLVSSDGPELQELEFDDSFTHTRIEIPRHIKPWSDLVALLKLFFLFRREKFEVVHSITPKAGLLTAVAAWLARVPIRLHTFTGQPWVTMTGPLRLVSKMADQLIGLLCSGCYADSKSQRQFLVDEKIISSRKIKIIAHGSLAGVDLFRFNPERFTSEDKEILKEELLLPSSATVIIFIGRIAKDKGVAELFSAFNRIRNVDGCDVELLVLGPNDKNIGGKHDLTDNFLEEVPGIHCLGYTSNPEKYLSISDLLCLPSYREGFGTVVIEASAMGVPTLGTKINGLIDAVEEGVSGLLVPPRDENALFDALHFFMEHKSLMKTMGENSRKRCENLFDSKLVNKAMAEEYVALLERGVTFGQ